MRQERSADQKLLRELPELACVNSGETFGLVHSAHAATFAGLYQFKQEDDTDNDILESAVDNHSDLAFEAAALAHELQIDEKLFSVAHEVAKSTTAQDAPDGPFPSPVSSGQAEPPFDLGTHDAGLPATSVQSSPDMYIVRLRLQLCC